MKINWSQVKSIILFHKCLIFFSPFFTIFDIEIISCDEILILMFYFRQKGPGSKCFKGFPKCCAKCTFLWITDWKVYKCTLCSLPRVFSTFGTGKYTNIFMYWVHSLRSLFNLYNCLLTVIFRGTPCTVYVQCFTSRI